MGFFGGGGGAAVANMVGATSSTAGTAGLVPAPAAGKNTRALFSDASFGEVPLLPQYKASNTRCIKNYLAGAGGAGGTFTINVRHFALIYAPADGNIDTLLCMTSAAPSPAFNFNLALWENSQAGEPSTYIAGANITSGTGGFAKLTASISTTAIKKGFHWLSVTTDATTSANAVRVTSNLGTHMFLGSSQPDGNLNTFNYTCASSYDQTTHETFLLTATNVPLVAFEYA